MSQQHQFRTAIGWRTLLLVIGIVVWVCAALAIAASLPIPVAELG